MSLFSSLPALYDLLLPAADVISSTYAQAVKAFRQMCSRTPALNVQIGAGNCSSLFALLQVSESETVSEPGEKLGWLLQGLTSSFRV